MPNHQPTTSTLSPATNSKGLLINTRPSERLLPSVLAGMADVLDIYHMPLLALQAYDTPMNAVYQNQLIAGAYRLLVVVSPSAANYALATLDDNNKQTLITANHSGALTIVAVGKATADVLRCAGFLVLVPFCANNEGMLAMPIVQALTAKDKVLIWKGVAGRTLLIETLMARQVAVDSCLWYQRVMPDTLKSQAFTLKTLSYQYKHRWLLISSGSAWQHWQQIAKALDIKLQSFHYIALGERLTKLIAPTACVSTLASLDELPLFINRKLLINNNFCQSTIDTDNYDST